VINERWLNQEAVPQNTFENPPQKKENLTAKVLYTSTEQLSFAVLVSLKTERELSKFLERRS
jgi:hypothetical protein